MKEPETTGPRYWKSLDDLAETPAFREWVEREFPAGASELDGVNRRRFLKIMAASFGFAGLGMTGCRRPEHHILPYSDQPEHVLPGVPIYFTSSAPGESENVPVIVETHQGRPTKVEGNPSYKPYGGGTDVYTQAGILDLYDPDRLTRSREGNRTVPPEEVRDRLKEIGDDHAEDSGRGLVFLARPNSSPSRRRMVGRLRERFPEAVWAEYNPVGADAPERASEAVFGRRLRTLPDFDKAKRILALDSDFLHEGAGGLGHARAFARNRKLRDASEADQMSRLYVVESRMTSTGAMADHRVRLSGSHAGAFAARLGAAVLRAKGRGGELLGRLDELGAGLSVDDAWIRKCAEDLAGHEGEALVVAGAHLPASVHAIVFAVNEALGANGRTLRYIRSEEPADGIQAAAERLASGEGKTLVVLGGNPVYDAPADLAWSELQKKAERRVHLSYEPNETAETADLVIARSHYLESWGDGRAWDGTLLPVQPMIEPLFPSFDELEVLARIAGEEENDPYAIARATFDELGGTDYERFLSLGLLEDSASESVQAAAGAGPVLNALDPEELAAPELNAGRLEIRFTPSFHGYDGRYANNGWMMECPDPMTKLTWDNAILVSPRLAKELEAEQGPDIFPELNAMNEGGEFLTAVKGTLQRNKANFEQGREEAVVVELTLDGRTLRAPVHVVPGMADYTVVLPLGMGREKVGRVGRGVGFDAYPMRAGTGRHLALGGALRLTEETYQLANTQEHWSMEGRAIVREGTTEKYKKNPHFANEMGVESHAPANYGKYDDKPLHKKVQYQYRGNSAYEHPVFSQPAPNVDVWKGNEDKFPRIQQWGMAIDLNSCTGCSACVVACQSENNTPIVGKEQVLRGREMHWMRLDRYFSAADYEPSEVPEDVQVSFMSMLCQHCENAPCESVCPVNATLHDEQGLNVMAYNRCVGTRYCANNCPYKVRRFNFFDWNKRAIGEYYKGPLGKVDEPELHKMQKNPDVTVRMRGVMEKCTFCVQRIESAKNDQKRIAGNSGNIHVPDGRIKTACQQVCPTEAITFGDVSDPESEVSRIKASDRDYSVLGYLNTRPRTTYLARVRNPNPDMPDTYKQPHAYKAYKERYGSGSHESGSAGAHEDSEAAAGADTH